MRNIQESEIRYQEPFFSSPLIRQFQSINQKNPNQQNPPLENNKNSEFSTAWKSKETTWKSEETEMYASLSSLIYEPIGVHHREYSNM